MQTKQLCVLIHIGTKGKVRALLNWFKPSVKHFIDRIKAVLLLSIVRLRMFVFGTMIFFSAHLITTKLSYFLYDLAVKGQWIIILNLFYAS